MDFPIEDGGLAAAVIVRDSALRMSLRMMLGACGVATTEAETIGGFFADTALREAAIFVDRALIGRKLAEFIDPLRSRGWNGIVVTMAEDETAGESVGGPHEQCMVLVKPFSSEEVIKIVNVILGCRPRYSAKP